MSLVGDTLLLSRILHESVAVACLAGVAFAVVRLASNHPCQTSLNTTWGEPQLAPMVYRYKNGRVGAYLADALASLLNTNGSFVWVSGGSVR